MRNLVGQQIGPYKMEELLGSGGMADVYRAHQANLDRYVAIKVLKTSLADDPEFVARFSREAMAAGGLRHQNILRIYDAGTFEGWHYIVMDYVTGGTLAQYADQKGPLPIDEATQLAIQVADALAYAHSRPRPIIHRDLKPSNILMDDGRPLLTDFGIAYMVSTEQRLTQTGSSLGTPEYMSPEQSEGLPVDGRTDIYSLGIMLYQLVTGRVPFQANTPIATMHQVVYAAPPAPRQFNSDIPDWMESIILRALAKRPVDRFATAKEMADALRQQQLVSIPAQSVTEAGVTQVFGHEKRGAAAVAGAAAANRSIAAGGSASAPARASSPAGAPAATPAPRSGGRGVMFAVLGVALLAVLGSAAYLAMPRLRGGGSGQQVAVVSTAPTMAAVVQPTVAPASPTAQPTPVPAVASPAPAVKLESAAVASPTTEPAATAQPADTSVPTNTPAPPTTAPTATAVPATNTPAPTATATAQLAAAAPPSAAAPPAAAPTAPPAAPAKPGTVLDFESFGTWRRGDQPYGTLTQSNAQAHSGKFSAKLAYDFPAVDQEFVVFTNPGTPLPGKPAALTAWVYGDGSGHFLNAWVKDSAGQVRQFTFGRVSHQGWQQMIAPLDTTAAWPQGHISGPDSAQLTFPLSLQALVLDAVPHNKASSGALYIDDVATSDSATQPAAPAAGSGSNAAPAAQAGAAAPSAVSGHIVFPASREGRMDIMALDAASGNVSQVTPFGRQPAMRGDGRIVYNGVGGGRDSLSVVNLDGSGQTSLSNHPEDAYPSWAPDGATATLYSSATGGENRIYTIPATARNQEAASVQYNGQPLLGEYPTWLDNWRIAFSGCGYQWGSGGLCGIWSINNDGTNPQRMTDLADDRSSNSRGGRLLFTRSSGGNAEVYVTSDNGGAATNLTNSPSQDWGASFSPDGRSIAYLSNRDGWSIWIMNADGSGQRKLVDVPGGFGGDWQAERLSWGS